MKRPIKFRAWHKDASVMLYPDNGKQSYVFYWEEEGQPVEIMQFTGLKDKNGKEIYEGDILMCERDYWNVPRKLVVAWDDECAGFFLLNTKNIADSETFDKESTFVVREYQREIIGNIYENPELLA